MESRPLGITGLELPILSFGASSLGAEFRQIDIEEALNACRTALDGGMNFVDTSPFYGRGMSEILLGRVLPEYDRDSYILQTKLGRYAGEHFDFSARRVRESVDISLERMKVDKIDIVLCHDLEFVEMSQIVNETLPALRRVVETGKVDFIGVSGYPMKMFRYILDQAGDAAGDSVSRVDAIMSYNHYTLQNDMATTLVDPCRTQNVGLMNAAPFSARLLTDATLPDWHKAPKRVRDVCAQAAAICRDAGSDLAKLALQFSIANPDFATTVTGSANPGRVEQWIGWANEPIDEDLLATVQQKLAPIHNWYYTEGRPENNDPVCEI